MNETRILSAGLEKYPVIVIQNPCYRCYKGDDKFKIYGNDEETREPPCKAVGYTKKTQEHPSERK